MPNQLKWLFGLLCGVALFGLQVYGFYKTTQCGNWPATSGQVVQSEMRRSGRTYRSVVEYEYRVGSKKYSSRNVCFAGMSFFAHSTTDKYQRNQHVKVFYNPDLPSEAVLEREFPASAYVVMLIGIGICLAFGWPLFVSKSSSGKTANSTASFA